MMVDFVWNLDSDHKMIKSAKIVINMTDESFHEFHLDNRLTVSMDMGSITNSFKLEGDASHTRHIQGNYTEEDGVDLHLRKDSAGNLEEAIQLLEEAGYKILDPKERSGFIVIGIGDLDKDKVRQYDYTISGELEAAVYLMALDLGKRNIFSDSRDEDTP